MRCYAVTVCLPLLKCHQTQLHDTSGRVTLSAIKAAAPLMVNLHGVMAVVFNIKHVCI